MSVPKLELLTRSALEELIHNDNLHIYEHLVPRVKKTTELSALKVYLKKVQARLERHKAAYCNGVDTLQEYKINKERCKNEENLILEKIQLLTTEELSEKKIKVLKNSVVVLVDLLFSNQYDIEQKSIAIKSIIDKIQFNKYTGEFIVYYFS